MNSVISFILYTFDKANLLEKIDARRSRTEAAQFGVSGNALDGRYGCAVAAAGVVEMQCKDRHANHLSGHGRHHFVGHVVTFEQIDHSLREYQRGGGKMRIVPKNRYPLYQPSRPGLIGNEGIKINNVAVHVHDSRRTNMRSTAVQKAGHVLPPTRTSPPELTTSVILALTFYMVVIMNKQ
jgi:hypothetical protein